MSHMHNNLWGISDCFSASGSLTSLGALTPFEGRQRFLMPSAQRTFTTKLLPMPIALQKADGRYYTGRQLFVVRSLGFVFAI